MQRYGPGALTAISARLQAGPERQGLQNRRNSAAQVLLPSSCYVLECSSELADVSSWSCRCLCRFLNGYSKVDEAVRNGYSEVDRRFNVGEKAGDVANRSAIEHWHCFSH